MDFPRWTSHESSNTSVINFLFTRYIRIYQVPLPSVVNLTENPSNLASVSGLSAIVVHIVCVSVSHWPSRVLSRTLVLVSSGWRHTYLVIMPLTLTPTTPESKLMGTDPPPTSIHVMSTSRNTRTHRTLFTIFRDYKYHHTNKWNTINTQIVVEKEK